MASNMDIVNSMFKKPDIHFYRIAMQEIESGQLEKGNWAKALVSTQGDEFRARTAYIKLRVKELTGAQP